MDTMAASPSPTIARAPRRLTVTDFIRYEHRYHLTHRFPTLQTARCPSSECTVAEGYIDECQPWHNLQLVGSDLTVHQTYETHARADAPAHASIIVMLEGHAELMLGEQHHRLAPGDGLLLIYT
ncbi:MAG: hypothetical protein UMU75_11425, partial [Halomonas sp.]|nr:hypothetical protein [Halomonas sp.]